MDIGNMDFNNRSFNRGNCIANSHRCMRVSARVKNNSVIFKTDPLQFIDKFPFYIALKIMQMNMRILVLQFTKINFKWFIAINISFPLTEKIEIRPIDNSYLHLTNVIKLKNTLKEANAPAYPLFYSLSNAYWIGDFKTLINPSLSYR